MLSWCRVLIVGAGLGLAALGIANDGLQAESIRFVQLSVEAQKTTKLPWVGYTTTTIDQASLPTRPDAVNEYGGSLDWPAQSPSGFFRTERIDGRWWLIDPDGRRFLNAGLVAVNSGDSELNKANLKKLFSAKADWMTTTLAMLRSAGFNGAGAWSDTEQLRQTPRRFPYTRLVNFMSDYGKKRGGTFAVPGHTGFPENAMFVFDPEFPAFAQEYAKRLADTADDPWLLGIFSDNELPLYDKTLDGFLRLRNTDPGRQAAEHWLLVRQGGSTVDFGRISQADRQAFVGYVLERYGSIVGPAIRKVDTHHLFLGSRLHGDERFNPFALKAAGAWDDVVAINHYGFWTPEAKHLADWDVWSGKPVLISEWYTKGADTAFANSTGAGWIVRTQADRGRFYQNYVLALLKSRTVVGWQWFKYLDNDPTDLKAELSNRDSNKGLVNLDYQPYQALLERMRALNQQMYTLVRQFDSR